MFGWLVVGVCASNGEQKFGLHLNGSGCLDLPLTKKVLEVLTKLHVDTLDEVPEVNPQARKSRKFFKGKGSRHLELYTALTSYFTLLGAGTASDSHAQELLEAATNLATVCAARNNHLSQRKLLECLSMQPQIVAEHGKREALQEAGDAAGHVYYGRRQPAFSQLQVCGQ